MSILTYTFGVNLAKKSIAVLSYKEEGKPEESVEAPIMRYTLLRNKSDKAKLTTSNKLKHFEVKLQKELDHETGKRDDKKIVTYLEQLLDLTTIPEDVAFEQAMNEFFKAINGEQRRMIFRFNVNVVAISSQLTVENFAQTAKLLREEVTQFMNGVDLIGLCFKYVKLFPPRLPDTSTSGARAHDTPEKTFLLEEYEDMTCISMVTKVLLIFFATFGKDAEQLRHQNIHAYLIPMHVFWILDPLFSNSVVSKTYNKFLNNIRRDAYRELGVGISEHGKFVSKLSEKAEKSLFVLSCHNLSAESVVEYICGRLLYRNLPSLNLLVSTLKADDRNPNIMTSLVNTVTHTVVRFLAELQMKSSLEQIPARFQFVDESLNTNLTMKTSNVCLDVPIILSSHVLEFCSLHAGKFLEQFYPGKGEETFKKMYTDMVGEQRVFPTDYTWSVLPIYAHRIVGTVKNLRYLKSIEWTALLLLCQLDLIKRNADAYWELAVLLTVTGDTPANLPETFKTDLVTQYKKSDAVVKLVSALPDIVNTKDEDGLSIGIRTQCDLFINWLFQKQHSVYILPEVRDILIKLGKNPPKNGENYSMFSGKIIDNYATMQLDLIEHNKTLWDL